MSHAMITQSFEIIQKSVFGRTLKSHMGMKGWFARGEPARDLLSDLRALQNRRHFGSNMFRANCAKHGFLQTNHNSIF
jgi:hypothetical protein